VGSSNENAVGVRGVCPTWSAQFLIAALFLLLASVSASAQANLGRILGTVTDQTGGVIAGATVTVLDLQRGISRTLTTDDGGEYNAPNLTPGAYTVRADRRVSRPPSAQASSSRWARIFAST